MSDASWTWSLERRIPSDTGQGRRIMDEILDQLRQGQWEDRELFGVHLALEEAVVNAIKHGNQHSLEKYIHVHCKIACDRVWIQVTDEGEGFELYEVPDPTADENVDRPSGRGIMLMRNFMCRVSYNEKGNRVVMEKARNSSEAE